jgi:hypothetical protein
MLQSTLFAHENTLLRSRVLRAEISAPDLVIMSADSLIAPEKLSARELETQKIFDQSLITESENHMVVRAQGEIDYLKPKTFS